MSPYSAHFTVHICIEISRNSVLCISELGARNPLLHCTFQVFGEGRILTSFLCFLGGDCFFFFNSSKVVDHFRHCQSPPISLLLLILTPPRPRRRLTTRRSFVFLFTAEVEQERGEERKRAGLQQQSLSKIRPFAMFVLGTGKGRFQD